MATIYHQVWLEASAQKVYEALATAESIGKWWAPHSSTLTAEGVEILAHDPGERHGEVRMKVTAKVPGERVEWEVISHHPEQSPASAWTGTRILFELSERPNPGSWRGIPEGDRKLAVLEFRHSSWDENSPFLGFCNFAWGAVLTMLKQACEKPAGAS